MTGLRVAGLFAGIGGIEQGLSTAGHHAELLNELELAAQTVLRAHFPGVPVTGDVRELENLPEVDLLAAGFPCTDISQAGRKVGISGSQSGLVSHIWRLVESQRRKPEWLLLENVSYLLSLDRGNGLKYLVDSVEKLGYRWAYRVVDARAFGIPQRRQRIVFLASRTNDPRTVLFTDDVKARQFDDSVGPVDSESAYGFYWTEGLRGLGWARDAVPTIKGGSGLGIPSAPAVWLPWSGEFGTPQIEDGERLQGFPVDWTAPGAPGGVRVGNGSGSRWKQVGNAVCVPMSTWVGQRLSSPGEPVDGEWNLRPSGRRWPSAAYGEAGHVWIAPVSSTPLREPYSLRKFLGMPLKPLSHRAAVGFLSRAARGRLRFSDGFIEALTNYANSIG